MPGDELFDVHERCYLRRWLRPRRRRKKLMFNRKLLNTQKIFLVFAGKGGTGKSTVASNLACHLSKAMAGKKLKRNRVGILDADIETPSISYLFGLQEIKHERDPDTRRLIPLSPSRYKNIDIYSMGSMPFISEELGTFWEKEEMRQFLIQSIIDVNWSKCNTIIVDLPAGIDQSIQVFHDVFKKIHGVIIVTQPSGVCVNDVQKAITTCQDLKVPIVGIVENMAGYVCPSCNHHSNPFGRSGASKLASKFELEVIGRIPLMEEISSKGDSGDPCFKDPEGVLDEVTRRIMNTRLNIWG
jgi:ATP-binding protein involved in chromosome partitioning